MTAKSVWIGHQIRVPAASCTTRTAPTSGPKGRRCNRRYSTRLLGSDPDSLHVATTCSFPPGSFLGAIQRLFFDVWYARSSAIARRHIGAACWLVLVRLYNLKRPKSQFWSTMGSFSMIGLFCLLCARVAAPPARRLSCSYCLISVPSSFGIHSRLGQHLSVLYACAIACTASVGVRSRLELEHQLPMQPCATAHSFRGTGCDRLGWNWCSMHDACAVACTAYLLTF